MRVSVKKYDLKKHNIIRCDVRNERMLQTQTGEGQGERMNERRSSLITAVNRPPQMSLHLNWRMKE